MKTSDYTTEVDVQWLNRNHPEPEWACTRYIKVRLYNRGNPVAYVQYSVTTNYEPQSVTINYAEEPIRLCDISGIPLPGTLLPNGVRAKLMLTAANVAWSLSPHYGRIP